MKPYFNLTVNYFTKLKYFHVTFVWFILNRGTKHNFSQFFIIKDNVLYNRVMDTPRTTLDYGSEKKTIRIKHYILQFSTYIFLTVNINISRKLFQ